jgi:hypothetical protein
MLDEEAQAKRNSRVRPERDLNRHRRVEAVLDDLLRKLDAARLSKDGPFRSLDDKEHYETRVMCAYRKYQAARYHLQNVRTLIGGDSVEDHCSLPEVPDMKGVTVTEIRATTTVSADQYAYELSAFLASLRSALDFLAMACRPCLKGVMLDSIGTLIRMAQKPSVDLGNPVFAAVKKNISWVLELREYRDQVVHRMVMTMYRRKETRVMGGLARTACTPIVVPEKPPRYLPDTRNSRMMAEQPLTGIDSSVTMRSVTYGNAKTLVVEHSVSFLPSSGYIPIESFMEKQLTTFEGFFVSMVRAIGRLGFQRPKSVQGRAAANRQTAVKRKGGPNG